MALWQKGQSGNPGGKPPGLASFRREMDRRYGKYSEKLLSEIEKLALKPHDNPMVRLKALELLMAYQRGKPIQALEHSGADGAPLVPIIINAPGAKP